MVAWGGALLAGLAFARAVTRVSIARIRAAGFEMLWRGEGRLHRVGRGEIVELEAEIRNRDTRAARYVALRSVCSPALEVEVDPESGEVPAGGRMRVNVRVHTPRVGRHGIHGLSLEVQGNPGLFEVPLTFANPYGIEVLPRPFATGARSARGGRSRMSAPDGHAGPMAGDGSELRELRQHQPGDPFKRIAWRASARRGTLMVREYEQEERDVVWLLLDASVELWSGEPGLSPLDLAIDEVAAVAQRHLARGDRVGLMIVGARVLSQIAPDRGPNHGVKLMTALSLATGCVDADRSDLDESDVALRVLEHLRPLDPAAAAKLKVRDLDRLVRRVERVRRRAPFARTQSHAVSARERSLREYIAQFGLYAPPRTEPERPKTDTMLREILKRLPRERPAASVVYLWSLPPAPGTRPELERALMKFPRRRIDLRFVSMRQEPSLPREGSLVAGTVADALALRAKVARQRGERQLRAFGVRIEKPRPPKASYRPSSESSDPDEAPDRSDAA